ncbi:MAG: helix-turn-helix transcriptional regulator [Eggerthellaceae bacterium]|nr:helix-turn-helix transcriptional regulator [Eggerthellaceae bacterium]
MAMVAFDSTHFARVLKSRRELKGWDQETLAKESGVSRNAIARYETELNVPGFETVCKLAAALGCSTDEFVKEA